MEKQMTLNGETITIHDEKKSDMSEIQRKWLDDHTCERCNEIDKQLDKENDCLICQDCWDELMSKEE